MTTKKFDFRNANKSDLLALSQLLLNVQKALSSSGHKITIKQTTSSKTKNNADEQKFTQIS